MDEDPKYALKDFNQVDHFNNLVDETLLIVVPHALTAVEFLSEFQTEYSQSIRDGFRSTDADAQQKARVLYENLIGALAWKPLSFVSQQLEALGVTRSEEALTRVARRCFGDAEMFVVPLPLTALANLVVHHALSASANSPMAYDINMISIEMAETVSMLRGGTPELVDAIKKIEGYTAQPQVEPPQKAAARPAP